MDLAFDWFIFGDRAVVVCAPLPVLIERIELNGQYFAYIIFEN